MLQFKDIKEQERFSFLEKEIGCITQKLKGITPNTEKSEVDNLVKELSDKKSEYEEILKSASIRYQENNRQKDEFVKRLMRPYDDLMAFDEEMKIFISELNNHNQKYIGKIGEILSLMASVNTRKLNDKQKIAYIDLERKLSRMLAIKENDIKENNDFVSNITLQ